MRFLVPVLVVAGTATAFADSIAVRAEPPQPGGYVTFGGIAGWDQLTFAGLQLDGGVRIETTALYVRGALEVGDGSRDLFENGTYVAARLGIEARRCWNGCWFAGVDGGARSGALVRQSPKDDMGTRSTYDHKLVVLRAGIETGTRVLFRFAIEIPTAFDGSTKQTGAALAASIGFAF